MDDLTGDEYELLDAGDGRRLERFGAWLVDRPAPGATGPRRDPRAWAGAISYRGGLGWVTAEGEACPEGETPVRLAGAEMLRMLAGLATGGQVGIFPEHGRNVGWVRGAVERRAGGADGGGEVTSVVNLFAYTGLLTLVAADAGAAVTHVDASRPAVQWARRNADANGLAARPVRWIVDDAIGYLRREARRGRRYDGLILDPPSYGHGGAGGPAGAFRLDRDIEELLGVAIEVAAPDAFWLLSTHTIGWDADRLASTLAWVLGARPRQVEGLPLDLVATSGAQLSLGAAARFDPLAGEAR